MGPNPDGAIKPDLVAVGANVYTATQKLDPAGDLYDPSGYGVFDGTSFSTPLVSGAVALVKAARPGLTAAQYRSLVINNAGSISYAPGTPATVQQAGAGILDVSAALRSTAAMSPVSISFGIGAARRPSPAALPFPTWEPPPRRISFPRSPRGALPFRLSPLTQSRSILELRPPSPFASQPPGWAPASTKASWP